MTPEQVAASYDLTDSVAAAGPGGRARAARGRKAAARKQPPR